MENERHLLIIGDDKGEREFGLDSSVYTIGKDPKCNIRLVSQFVSCRHATLTRITNDDSTFCYQIMDGVADTRSANGILVNGRRLKVHTLQNKDEVIFGPQVCFIYYVCSGEPPEDDLEEDLKGCYSFGGPTLINPLTM